MRAKAPYFAIPAKVGVINAVMPAEAGIQVLNGIARQARDLNSYLWVSHPQVHAAAGRSTFLSASGIK